MNFIRQRVKSNELLSGTFCNLGSSITTEIAGHAGLDWLLIDLEHGSGDQGELMHQLQAASATNTPAIVRIAANESWRFKRVLDAGAAGVMVPMINNSKEAKNVVASLRYHPSGIRGAAVLNRATNFGINSEDYFDKANKELLTVVQIETEQAVKNSEDIASVEGVDVLFVGPYDLSINLGIKNNYNNPTFISALEKVSSNAQKAGKSSGILLQKPEQLKETIERGFTFIAMGSDGGLVANGMKNISRAFQQYR